MAERTEHAGGKQSCDRKFLEHQYSPSRWSKSDTADEIIPKHIKIITEASKKTLKEFRCDVDVHYGQNSGEQMDIFFPQENEEEKQLVFVFIHGGYWQELGKEYYSFFGSILGQYGISTVVVGYDLAPKVKMKTIAEEIENALRCIHGRFPLAKLVVCGHSAGAHLTALLLKTNWDSLGISSSPIKGVVLISGIYDLRPLVNTYVNDALKMNEEEVLMLSPLFSVCEMKSNSNCKVLSLIGKDESPEFHRQSQEFAEALKNAGFSVEHIVVEKTDHFSVVHNFTVEGYHVTERIVQFVNEVSKG